MNCFDLLDSRLRDALARLGISAPSDAQEQMIPALMRGEDLLLVAPTGIGKTEAAMLPIFNDILNSDPDGFYVLYITPLRALNRDMLRRLEWFGQQLGITVGVRHGDTSQYERAKQSKHPPQILITTPETFQILLTGKKLALHLRNVRWVVVDEIHELAQDERGAQLSVGLERLASLTGKKFRRIGLSATIGTPEDVAGFLGGAITKIKIINVAREKKMDIIVSFPKPAGHDKNLSDKIHSDLDSAARLRRCKELIDSHKSTLLFVNTRNTAEVLAARFHLMDEEYKVGVHHGSLFKNVRVQMEEEFKSGILKGLICTSSLELGIDVGSADFTIQYNSPREATRLIQRVGRAGHSIGETSKGEIIADTPDDLLEAAVIARRALAGELEETAIRQNPMAVLANQIVGFTMESGDWDPDGFFEMLRRSCVFRDLARGEYDKVLRQLGELRIIWLGEDYVSKSRNSLGYFFDNVSMIPDERTFKVVDMTTRRIIGTLDEGFVVAYAEPDAPFIVRGLPWRIVDIQEDSILVEPAKELGVVPSWAGEEIPVPFSVAQEVGRLRETINFDDYPLTESAKKVALEYLAGQEKSGCALATDRRIVVEKEDRLVVVNACFGSKVNETLGKLLAALVMSKLGASVVVHTDPYRIMIQLPRPMDVEGLISILKETKPDSLESYMRLYLRRSSYLRWKFLYVAKKFGAIKKDADYRNINIEKVMTSLEGTPIMEEAVEKCLWELMDCATAGKVLGDIQEGKISILTAKLSPMGKAGIEVYGDVLMPQRPTHAILAALKSRLEKERVAIVCTHCRRKGIRLVGSLPEKLVCDRCGSVMQAVVRMPELEKISLLAKKSLSAEESKHVKRIMKSANLVKTYGKKAVLALAGRGVGPENAGRLLARPHEDEDEFLAMILAAEVNYARTKKFWD
jgi:ATP-dependent Lhr-like helicase